jgi:hypothetical protein
MVNAILLNNTPFKKSTQNNKYTTMESVYTNTHASNIITLPLGQPFLCLDYNDADLAFYGTQTSTAHMTNILPQDSLVQQQESPIRDHLKTQQALREMFQTPPPLQTSTPSPPPIPSIPISSTATSPQVSPLQENPKPLKFIASQHVVVPEKKTTIVSNNKNTTSKRTVKQATSHQTTRAKESTNDMKWIWHGIYKTANSTSKLVEIRNPRQKKQRQYDGMMSMLTSMY